MPLPRPTGDGHEGQDPLGKLWLGCMVYGGADPPGLTAKELNSDTAPRTASVGPWAKAP